VSEEAPKPSWFDGLRRGVDSAVGLVQSRLEIFSVELQEEKLRTLRLLLWLGLAVALGGAGLMVIIAALALFLWSTAGYLGLIGLALLTFAAAAAVVWQVRKAIQNGPTPFHTTVNEFRKDRECLHSRE